MSNSPTKNKHSAKKRRITKACMAIPTTSANLKSVCLVDGAKESEKQVIIQSLPSLKKENDSEKRQDST